MTAPCTHTRTGLVTSRPLGGIEESYAAAPVCDSRECIDAELAWVARVSGKPARYIRDEVAS